MHHNSQCLSFYKLNGFQFRALRVNAAYPSQNTLFYVGGAFQGLEDLSRAKQPLTLHSNIVYVELPGFGLADALPSEYSFEFYVECLDLAFSLCGEDKVIAYGYSYGVGPLFKAVSRWPKRFLGMVIASACASFTDRMIDVMQQLIDLARHKPAGFPEAFEKALCFPDKTAITKGRASALMIRRMLRSQPQESLNRFAQNYERLLKEHQAVDFVTQPILGLVGEHDVFVAPNRLWGFSAFCQTFEGHILKDCDHFFHLQRPDAEIPFIQRFFQHCDEHLDQSIETARG